MGLKVVLSEAILTGGAVDSMQVPALCNHDFMWRLLLFSGPRTKPSENLLNCPVHFPFATARRASPAVPALGGPRCGAPRAGAMFFCSEEAPETVAWLRAKSAGSLRTDLQWTRCRGYISQRSVAFLPNLAGLMDEKVDILRRWLMQVWQR